MKLVSAGKLRKARSLFERTNENAHFITKTIRDLFDADTEVPPDYLEGSREIKNTAYIIITSSKGLCGGFNTNVIKMAQSGMDELTGEPVIFAIGGKGLEYFEKRGYSIEDSYLAPPESITFLEAKEMVGPLLEMYENGTIDEIVIVYTSFASAIEQKVVKERLLPFRIEENPAKEGPNRHVVYEPSTDVVFNYLIPKFVEMKIYSAVIESATCEHAARRMAMENATDNARDMLDRLNLNYNRARQTAITNEIIEIVAGAEAQAG